MGNVTFGVKRALHYERHSGIGFEGKWGVCNVTFIIGHGYITKGTLVLVYIRIYYIM